MGSSEPVGASRPEPEPSAPGREAPAAEREPLILSVQHFCIHDGPGVRSLVFFKGCPLRCAWCQNPESWSPRAQLGFKPHLCIACRTCVEVCPNKAVTAPGVRDHGRCRLCFTCVDHCPSGAMVRFGEPRSVESIVDELRPEFPLFRQSGGGVTLSGGEPTMFPRFAADLARRLKAEGIHVAMETCGEFDLAAAGDLLASLDLVLFDIKVFDDAEQRRWCGVGNNRIKANLRAMVAAAAQGKGPRVWPRMPLIPEAIDTPRNFDKWGGLLQELGIPRMTLVPYHNLGDAKRDWLGISAVSLVKSDPDRTAAGHPRRVPGVDSCAPGEEVF